MIGDQRLEHIIFRSGSLFVPKEKTVLQKLLSLYHPHKNKIYEEFKPAKIAADEAKYGKAMKAIKAEERRLGRKLSDDEKKHIMRLREQNKLMQHYLLKYL